MHGRFNDSPSRSSAIRSIARRCRRDWPRSLAIAAQRSSRSMTRTLLSGSCVSRASPRFMLQGRSPTSPRSSPRARRDGAASDSCSSRGQRVGRATRLRAPFGDERRAARRCPRLLSCVRTAVHRSTIRHADIAGLTTHYFCAGRVKRTSSETAMHVTAPRVISVNVGTIREVKWHGRRVTTGIWKHSVDGRIALRGVNFVGDDQADRTVHGGPDKAAYAYAREDYDYWRDEQGIETSKGLFGENLTTEGLDLSKALVGERWSVGSTLLEVAQPRLPCNKP